MWSVWVRIGVYKFLVSKLEGMRPLGRPRRRWEDIIRMDLQEVGCNYVDWIWLVQDTDKWRTLECGNESSGSIKYGQFLDLPLSDEGTGSL